MKTKHLFVAAMFFAVSGLFFSSCQSVKVTKDVRNVRMIDGIAEVHVKPQVVDFEIMPSAEVASKVASLNTGDRARKFECYKETGRVEAKFIIPEKYMKEMLNSNDNKIKIWGASEVARAFHADVIVGAVFEYKTCENSDDYELTVVGYPARFKNWRSLVTDDYKWMEPDKFLERYDTKIIVKD